MENVGIIMKPSNNWNMILYFAIMMFVVMLIMVLIHFISFVSFNIQTRTKLLGNIKYFITTKGLNKKMQIIRDAVLPRSLPIDDDYYAGFELSSGKCFAKIF